MKLLFICVENTCRSQMAEGLADIGAHGLGDHAVVEADARGLNPILRPDGSVFVPEGARNKSVAHDLAKQWAAHVRHREEVRSRVVPTVGLVG